MNRPQQVDSPWPHRLAVLLACAAFVLIWVGGLVTTTQAGMAVEDWPSTWGYNLFLYPWQSWLAAPWDLFVEHGHRLLASAVGMLTILLAAVLWRKERRIWVRTLSWVAVAGVVLQGVLGGVRVLLDDRMMAMIHGCVGPAYFALCVVLATVTSPRWRCAATPKASPAAGRLQTLALLTAALAYVQLVLGANVRHTPPDASYTTFRVAVVFHLLMAAILSLHVGLLCFHTWHKHRGEKALLWPATLTASFVFFQLALGGSTWLVQYGPPRWLDHWNWTGHFTVAAGSALQSLVVTAHAAAGSLILGTLMVMSLCSFRVYKTSLHRLPGRAAAWGLA